MSFPRPTEAKPNNNNTLRGIESTITPEALFLLYLHTREANMCSAIAAYPEDSDEDLFTVPDVEAAAVTNPNGSNLNQSNVTDPQLQTADIPGKRRRGRNPVDKEYKRLKRLLRNRVSAQQARERKKVYVSDLESRAKGLEEKNAKLEERISTLINENTMLRKVLMSTRPKVDENIES